MSGGRVVIRKARDVDGHSDIVLATDYAVLQSDLDAAIARAEALERDAARYRWLRDNPRHEHHPYFDDSVGKWCCPYLASNAGGHGGGVGLRFFDTLDAAIAAQQAEGEDS